jgi:hypothetical protein
MSRTNKIRPGHPPSNAEGLNMILIMAVIPYSRTVISTALDSETIRERLLTVVGPEKDFGGKLTSNGFRLRRNPWWEKDPYRPVVDGKFNSRFGVIGVQVRFWASPFGLASVAAFFGVGEYMALSRDISMWWWPIAASITLHVGLCFFSFVPGRKWAENRLRSVLAPGR